MLLILTRKSLKEKKKLKNFYDLVHTPVDHGEESSTEVSCVLPVGVTATEHKRFALPGGIHIPIPNKLTVVGFLVCWAIVFAMIAFLYWLMS